MTRSFNQALWDAGVTIDFTLEGGFELKVVANDKKLYALTEELNLAGIKGEYNEAVNKWTLRCDDAKCRSSRELTVLQGEVLTLNANCTRVFALLDSLTVALRTLGVNVECDGDAWRVTLPTHPKHVRAHGRLLGQLKHAGIAADFNPVRGTWQVRSRKLSTLLRELREQGIKVRYETNGGWKIDTNLCTPNGVNFSIYGDQVSMSMESLHALLRSAKVA